MWELLVLLLVVFGVHWWEYRSSMQEYTFAQPSTLDRHDELSTVLQEKTPIAVEIGSLPWRPQVAEKAAWTVTVDSNGSEMDMSVSQWLVSRSDIANAEALAEEMELANGLADIDAGRPWWWLPEMRDCNVSILNKGEGLGLKWISAERHWIGCSHGTPLTLWLVHSRYRRYLPNSAVNPWTLTVVEAPWIGRVQYIEVTIKPGWCIGLPAHWGFAVKADDESWMWSANQHSLVSFGLAKLTG
jgi:hypothetical protein